MAHKTTAQMELADPANAHGRILEAGMRRFGSDTSQATAVTSDMHANQKPARALTSSADFGCGSGAASIIVAQHSIFEICFARTYREAGMDHQRCAT